MRHLTTFHNGFQAIAEVVDQSETLTYKAKNPYTACDKARVRISELNLPLTAQVLNYNTLIVKPC